MKIRSLISCGLLTAVTAVLSLISVPLPFSPVPVSLGTLAVFLCGGLLKPREAVLSQAAYLLIGAVGLPVFAGFQSGVARLVGPTGGFLFSYPIMAAIISLATHRIGVRRGLYTRGAVGAVSMIAASLACYGMGTIWFCLQQQVDAVTALAACVLPFLAPDALKIVCCAILLPILRARLIRAEVPANI